MQFALGPRSWSADLGGPKGGSRVEFSPRLWMVAGQSNRFQRHEVLIRRASLIHGEAASRTSWGMLMRGCTCPATLWSGVVRSSIRCRSASRRASVAHARSRVLSSSCHHIRCSVMCLLKP